jgi:methyl-accepting chemotaxis protein
VADRRPGEHSRLKRFAGGLGDAVSRLSLRTLTGKIVLLMLVVAVIPMTVAGVITYVTARDSARGHVLHRLEATAKAGAQQVRTYLTETADDVKLLAVMPAVMQALSPTPKNAPYYHSRGPMADPKPITPSQSVQAALDRLFSDYLAIQETGDSRESETSRGSLSGYKDILLVNADGVVVYTLAKGPDLGLKLKDKLSAGSGLAEVWREVMETGNARMVDFAPYLSLGGAFAFLGAPVQGPDGTRAGALVLRMGPDRIDEIVRGTAYESIGTTGEAYIVGSDLNLRALSSQKGEKILDTGIDNRAATEALNDKTGRAEIYDADGTAVLKAWQHVGVNERRAFGADWEWGFIVKMDSAEAFASLKEMRSSLVLLGLIFLIAACVLAYVLGSSIVKPLRSLVDQTDQIAAGDLTVTMGHTDRHDELGALAAAFRGMVESLREQTKRIIEGITVLASSASEISTTVSELSVGTSRTSAAISQAGTTIEEVKQAARVVGDRAKTVAQTSMKAVEISDSGRSATEETIQKMNLIRAQMESIGETVVRLSDHSKAIEEIISAVQDLANQSNLLAVNAAIEAARAGEQGKGFTVVAHEIKTLADQSGDATKQVRSILDDTGKWVSAVVMATEQGGKAVESGVEQSILAGDSIQTLTDSVQEASQAATVIDASIEQQFTGVDQVSQAMISIQQAMSQSLSGTSQLEAAARRLTELGEDLKNLVKRYKV